MPNSQKIIWIRNKQISTLFSWYDLLFLRIKIELGIIDSLRPNISGIQIYWDYINFRNYNFLYRYVMIIFKVQRKPRSMQDLAGCDYFRISLVFQSLDICNIVGDIQEIRLRFSHVITKWKSTNHRKRPTTRCCGRQFFSRTVYR